MIYITLISPHCHLTENRSQAERREEKQRVFLFDYYCIVFIIFIHVCISQTMVYVVDGHPFHLLGIKGNGDIWNPYESEFRPNSLDHGTPDDWQRGRCDRKYVVATWVIMAANGLQCELSELWQKLNWLNDYFVGGWKTWSTHATSTAIGAKH